MGWYAVDVAMLSVDVPHPFPRDLADRFWKFWFLHSYRPAQSSSSSLVLFLAPMLVPPLVPSCTIIVIFLSFASLRQYYYGIWTKRRLLQARGRLARSKANLGIPPYGHPFMYGGFCGRVLLKLGYRHGQIVDRRPLCKMATSRTSQF
jgi:hypothetical protein